jgi:acetylglutamate kinase
MTAHIDIRQTDAADMTTPQQWMFGELATDIQAAVQQRHMTWHQAAEVLEKLAVILRQRHGAHYD